MAAVEPDPGGRRRSGGGRREWVVFPISVIVAFPLQSAFEYDWGWPARIWWEAPAFGLFIGLAVFLTFWFLNRNSQQ
jgi:hypothetical protein